MRERASEVGDEREDVLPRRGAATRACAAAPPPYIEFGCMTVVRPPSTYDVWRGSRAQKAESSTDPLGKG
jgi:hypothetical protein